MVVMCAGAAAATEEGFATFPCNRVDVTGFGTALQCAVHRGKTHFGAFCAQLFVPGLGRAEFVHAFERRHDRLSLLGHAGDRHVD